MQTQDNLNIGGILTYDEIQKSLGKFPRLNCDIVFSLPFSIPVYGDGVAILPLLMGVTLFLTMRMSSATMDKNQKPVMYFMNGFFILLFNSFPSGLNLYYTTYNLMSFLQQKGIKNKLRG